MVYQGSCPKSGDKQQRAHCKFRWLLHIVETQEMEEKGSTGETSIIYDQGNK